MKFDFNTIKDFDVHILKSIPNYDILISSIKSISEYFFVDNTNIYDLGCSTGKLLKSLNTKCNKIGYDVADLLPKETGFFTADLNKEFKLENVKGITLGASANLLGSSQGSLFESPQETIYDALTGAGYNLRYKVLNSKYYGVPQSRERTIFIGVRKDINKPITYPVTKGENVSLNEAFEGLEYNGIEGNIEKYAIYQEALKIRPGEQSEKYFSLVKLNPEYISPTLTATAGNIGAASLIHWDNRKITVKEGIRICSFPDDYYLGDDYSNSIERLGRAVPPLMMRSVAEHVYETILKEDKPIIKHIDNTINF